MMLDMQYAKATMPGAKGGYHLEKLHYDTQDIIDLMLKKDGKAMEETLDFSKDIPPTVEGMKMIYDFLLYNIEYRRDPKGAQWVKSPSRLISDEVGDCKSYTHFTTSVLRNLGIDYELNFASYNPSRPKPYHVYPTAIINGMRIHIDAVWGRDGGVFGKEKRPVYKTLYQVKKGLAYLSGTSQMSATATEDIIQTISELDRMIPDSVLQNDVTEMTEGQAQRLLVAQRMEYAADMAISPGESRNYLNAANALTSGEMVRIGSVNQSMQPALVRFMRETERMTQPAVKAPTLRFRFSEEADISGLFDIFKKIGKGIGSGVKAVGKGVVAVGKGVWNGVKAVGKGVGAAFKFVWKKLLNMLLKTALPGAGVFYLFTFLKKSVNPEVDRRKAAQKKHLSWMINTTGMKESNVSAALHTGILKDYGADPKQVLNNKTNAQVGAIGGAIAGALGWILKAVKAIAKLFKKPEPQISERDASDIDLLPDLSTPNFNDSLTKKGSPSYSPNPSVSEEDKGGIPWGLLIGIGAGAFMLTRA
ncbi:MAG: transglutaminase domain-containing protein [Bacteroidota bacterium]